MRTLGWIKDGRIRRAKLSWGDIALLGVEVMMMTAVFEWFECVCAKVSDPKNLGKESIGALTNFFLEERVNERKHDMI